MASGCVPGSGGRRAGSGRTEEADLIRFIADFTTKAGIRHTGCVIEYL